MFLEKNTPYYMGRWYKQKDGSINNDIKYKEDDGTFDKPLHLYNFLRIFFFIYDDENDEIDEDSINREHDLNDYKLLSLFYIRGKKLCVVFVAFRSHLHL